MFQKFVSKLLFGELQLTQISKFSNFLLQHKNQRSSSKAVYGLSIILILKGTMIWGPSINRLPDFR